MQENDLSGPLARNKIRRPAIAFTALLVRERLNRVQFVSVNDEILDALA